MLNFILRFFRSLFKNRWTMQVNATFDFARIFDISKMEIVKGQAFSLDTAEPGQLKWFSDNDPVLSLEVKGGNAEGKALQVGTSEIIIMSVDYISKKKLFISVVDSVSAPAVKLDAQAGAAEPKE